MRQPATRISCPMWSAPHHWRERGQREYPCILSPSNRRPLPPSHPQHGVDRVHRRISSPIALRKLYISSFRPSHPRPQHTHQLGSATAAFDKLGYHEAFKRALFIHGYDGGMSGEWNGGLILKAIPYVQLQPAELTSIPSMPSVCQACCDLSTSVRTVWWRRAISRSISGDSPICEE